MSDLQILSRKRIWEVDCLSLDAAVAASFDWRDLINLLHSEKHEFDLQKPAALLEIEAQSLLHQYSHSCNTVSLRVENLLNEWHAKTVQRFAEMEAGQAAEYVLSMPLEKDTSYGGVFWALGTDARAQFDCVRRRFHQRFQIVSVRRFAA